MNDMNQVVGRDDILFVTLDTLRYDVAADLLAAGRTPNLASILPPGGWERRHSPGNFTYSSHQAFFGGFLPTPEGSGPHERLFAIEFPGSLTTGDRTCAFAQPTIVEGLAERGYHTVCIGGVGFFNKLSPLGSVLPNLFHESHWSVEMGVTGEHSARKQFQLAARILRELPRERRIFLFINVSALHQPNCHYLTTAPPTSEGATADTIASHAAALEYVDAQLPLLTGALLERGRTFCILCSDHGTAYGEDGYFGHRLCHPVVWTVPYADFFLED